MAWEQKTAPTAQVYDLPFIGDDLAKIGRIIDLWAVNCSPSMEIWVYGFFEHFPTMFASIAKPELIDINIRHKGRKQRRGRRYRFGPADVFRDAIIEIPVPRWVVFRIYEAYQRAGWYMLVADATEQFAINWMSTAYLFSGCDNLQPAYATFSANRVLMGTSPGTGTNMLLGLDSVNNMIVSPPHATPLIPGTYRVTFTGTFDPAGQGPPYVLPYTAILYAKVGNDLTPIWNGEGQSNGAGGVVATGDAIVEIFSAEFPTFVLNTVGTDSGFFYGSALMAISLVDPEAFLPDP